jgi:3-hydroxyisobutyrate dehydrogenase
MKVGWVGVGRMGSPMVLRLLKAGYSPFVWNRTRSKAEALAARGVTVVEQPIDLRDAEVVFSTLSTGKDLFQVCFGENGLVPCDGPTRPNVLVDCSTIGIDESRDIRAKLAGRGVEYLAAPVSGNPRCIAAGKLSSVVSGSEAAFAKIRPLIEAYSARGVVYVGDGELARICKIGHNVMLATTIVNLVEITLMAQKAGIPRHTFLSFINNSVISSLFTQYKSPALVNLDWATTFTSRLMLKDIDLGLESARTLGVPAPVTAAVREIFQAHIGTASTRPDAESYLQMDFANIFETLAGLSGVKPQAENVAVSSGLEGPEEHVD